MKYIPLIAVIAVAVFANVLFSVPITTCQWPNTCAAR
jgi:hypothetical protein